MGVDGTRCASCGAPGRTGDRFCARCGRRVDDPPVLLVPLEGRDPPAVTQVAVAGSPPRPRASLTSLVIGAVACAVVVVAWSPWRDPGAATPAVDAAPTTTAHVDEGDDGETAAPTTVTAAPAPTVAVPTTVTAAPAPTVAVPTTAAIAAQPRLVLDPALAGRSLWVVAEDELVRADLGTGAVSRTALPGPGRIVGSAPGLVVVHVGRSNLLLVHHADGSAPVLHPVGADTPVAMSGTSAVWLLGSGDRRTEATSVRLLALDGSTDAQIDLPVGFWPQGFGDGRLWGERYGRIWSAGPDGVVRAYTAGSLVAVAGPHVLWVGCDDVFRCAYRLGAAGRPDTGRVTALATGLWPGAGPGLGHLSPDGRTAFDAVPGRLGPRFVDLATGATAEVENAQFGVVAWTPDGEWAVLARTSLTLAAADVRTGRTVELPFTFLSRGIGSFAIG